MTTPHRRASVAAPDFEKLYHDARASMFTARDAHAAALDRVNMLRRALIAALQHHPDAAAAAETAVGTRVSEFPDDVLIAYFQMAATTGAHNSAMQAASAARPLFRLRAALAAAGYQLPDTDDLTAWANTVCAHHQQIPEPCNDPRTIPDSGVNASAPVDTAPFHDAGPVWTSADDDALLASVFDDDPPSPTAAAAHSSHAAVSKVSPDQPLVQQAETTAHAHTGEVVTTAQMLLPSPWAPGVKPELPATPAKPPKTVRARARVNATAATSEQVAGVATIAAGLVAAPHPVFACDLVHAGATADDAAAWIAHARSTPGSGYRIVGAKNHHRQFGDLIIPDPSRTAALPAAWLSSAWGTVVTNMLGARVYEIALLLGAYRRTTHVSFDDRVSVFLAENDTGTMMGVVLISETKLSATSALCTRICDEVEQFLTREDVSTVAVLTSASARRGVEAVCDAVRTAGTARQWHPHANVIAARPVDVVSQASPPLPIFTVTGA